MSGGKTDVVVRRSGLDIASTTSLLELPIELVVPILEPLDLLTLLEVENCHNRLATLGHQVTVECVKIPTYALEMLVGDQENKWALLENPSVLDGRHVNTVLFENSRDYADEVKELPSFTCTNLIFFNLRGSAFFDANLLKSLAPKYIHLSAWVNGLEELDSLKCPIWISQIKVFQLAQVLLDFKAPKLAFGTERADERLLDLIFNFIDDWMTGHREIETIWIWPRGWAHNDEAYTRWYYEVVDIFEDDYPDDNLGFMEMALPELAKKYALATNSTGIIRGQVVREDGKVLNIRGQDTDIVVQAPGATTKFVACLPPDVYFSPQPELQHLEAPEF
ncbi:unnamed protein product, partial [Mesorhabditis spiculigera]